MMGKKLGVEKKVFFLCGGGICHWTFGRGYYTEDSIEYLGYFKL